jgi:voltage-gated sodium channel
VIVTVGGLFGMSLANAVFVDEMTSDNNDEIKAQLDAVNEQLEELKSMLERKT